MDTTIPPLSHSSANLILACEQKYFYHKIHGFEKDADVEQSDALVIGSAFHFVMEETEHVKPKSIRAVIMKFKGLPEEHINLVHAMCIKAYRVHEKMGLKIVGCELKLETDTFVGYVDAVMTEDNGDWWIVDFKTAATFKYDTSVLLNRDPQMSLYAFHRAQIAEQLGLDPEKFAGTRWRVITKSKAKKQKKEDDVAFVTRLITDDPKKGYAPVRAFDIPIPCNDNAIEERGEIHAKLVKRVAGLALYDAKPIRNYNSCFSFFRSCDFFSRCHGKLYSEMDALEITQI